MGSWAPSAEGWQQGQGGDCAALLCSCEAPPAAVSPRVEPAVQKTQGAVGEGPEESHEDYQGAAAAPL